MLQYRERYRRQDAAAPAQGHRGRRRISPRRPIARRCVERDKLRAMHDELAQRADGFITLSSPGPGPIGMDQGSAIFNEASSVLGAPAINLPLLAVDDAPLGVQLLGRWHERRAPDRRRALARRGPFRQYRLTGRLPPRPCWRGGIAVNIFAVGVSRGDVHALRDRHCSRFCWPACRSAAASRRVAGRQARGAARHLQHQSLYRRLDLDLHQVRHRTPA